MTVSGKILTFLVKAILKLICKVDDQGLYKVPDEGPLLIVFNHVNFLEAPVLRTRLLPKDVYALTKKETWDNPILRILANNWGGIPLDRENPAVSTLRIAAQLMKDNKILFIAPEGTRSGDGKLARGNPGIASIALRTKCRILPIGLHGGELFWKNIKRLKRTKLTITAGNILEIKPGTPASKKTRRDITDQIMYKLAETLPEHNRGLYSERPEYEEEYLVDAE